MAKLELYKYNFTKYIPIPGFIISEVLNNPPNKELRYLFDLNILYTLIKLDKSIKVTINIKDLYTKSVIIEIDSLHDFSDNSLYVISENGVFKAEMFSPQGYLKLHISRELKSSTLVINGLHMHQVLNKSPYEDAELKIRYARVRPGDRVLDICTGLGYTAIASLLRGAKRVVTIEIDRYVLRLAEVNPWSYLLSSREVIIINDDAAKVLSMLKDAVFDKVIHDPPRFNIAGELYSLEFYREVYRVLRPGGILFHYTGRPMRRRGRGLGPIIKGVKSRLERAGFIVKRYIDDVYGFIAIKPR